LLHLYQSNRLEKLMAFLAGVVAVPLRSPFAPEIVLVQGKGMERWVSLRLAERLGVCANIEFPLPASFAWQLMRTVLGDLPRRSMFAPDILAWRIMGWLGRSDRLAAAPRLQGYLEGGSDSRRYELAYRIAEVFDQYLVYRPDWIETWERRSLRGLGADEAWQAALWHDLAQERGGAHWASLMGDLLERLDGGMAVALPERIVLFGISSLSPLFLELVRKLAQRTEVHVFALNPSREYWELIRDPKEQARLAVAGDTAELFLETGNPLLASLGKQGRDFFGALAAFPELEDVFAEGEENADGTLLHALQSDILNLADPEAPDFMAHAIASGDRSVQIHCCHSAMREIEVLHDQLLQLFAASPQLLPSDVVVLSADSETSAPYIDAVFAPSDGTPFIPYGIAGQGGGGEQTLTSVFLALLDLPASRFTADWVLGLLEQPALLRRFGLAEDDLPPIHRWVRELNVRWGRDAAHKSELGLPGTPRHTWRDGLSRLMLGYALPQAVAGEALPMFGATLPYDDIEGGQAQVAGRFAEFVETLFELAETLKGALPLALWAQRLNGLVERMFDAAGEEEDAIRLVRDKLTALYELGAEAQFIQPVGIAVVKSWLAGQLEQPAGSGGSAGGGVSFCSMVPMRSLPFKVVCLLGMDDGAFPRRHTPVGFDLIAKHPRPGDRSRRLDDRYLFLEALLAARETLYVSYVGQDIRDNRELPPTVLVAELLDAVEASCGAETARQIVTRHFLQPFSPAYFCGATDYPGFSQAWLAAGSELGQSAAQSQPLFGAALPQPEAEWNTLELDRLIAFYAHPARYLLQQRLNIRLEEGDADFAIREPFGLDYFAGGDVRAQALETHLGGRPCEEARLLTEARGLLPHGEFGTALFAREEAAAEHLAARLLPQLPETLLDPVPLNFTDGELRLVGWLNKVSATGLLEYTLHEIKPRETYALWIRHLVLCHLKPPGVALCSLLIGTDKILRFGTVPDPERELAKLLDYYRQGLRSPLPFFLKTSHAYAAARYAGKDEDAALRAARIKWEGSENAFGEAEQVYYRAVYRDSQPLDERFGQVALDLLEPMLRAAAAGEGA
jgi:exodeoxyribonuclease V gamma subunit